MKGLFPIEAITEAALPVVKTCADCADLYLCAVVRECTEPGNRVCCFSPQKFRQQVIAQVKEP